MRRVALFVLAAALLIGGLSVIWWEMTGATTMGGIAIFVGAFAAAVGGYLIWDDVVWRDR